MISRGYTQTVTIRPTRPEFVMALVIVAMLTLNLVATIRAANYAPVCVPAIAIMETE